MKIAVVMASYLGEYAGCSTKREEKFIRAVESYMAQDYQDKCMVIVSDGCVLTKSVLSGFGPRIQQQNIYLIEIEKQDLLSGNVRMVGVEFSVMNLFADVVTYLDTDDYILPTHLSNIAASFEENKSCDWIWYNDQIKSTNTVRNAFLKKSKIGTSNISHKSIVPIVWGDGYGHDWDAIASMMYYKYIKANFSSYVVCHIPNQFDL